MLLYHLAPLLALNFLSPFKVDSQIKISCPHSLFSQNALKSTEGTVCWIIILISQHSERVHASLSCLCHSKGLAVQGCSL